MLPGVLCLALILFQAILAIDRGGLNKRLLDILEEMPNVKFFFNHKLTGADFRRNKAWFEVKENGDSGERAKEIESEFDLMIGADGAHSAVRYHMMKYTRMDYQQEYIDTLWCEFQIEPRTDGPQSDPNAKFRISPNHLHIWPGRDFMFIAIPSEVYTLSFLVFVKVMLTILVRMAHSHAPSLPRRQFTNSLRPIRRERPSLLSSTSTFLV